MPIAEHKQWCSILRGQQEMDRKAQAGQGQPPISGPTSILARDRCRRGAAAASGRSR